MASKIVMDIRRFAPLVIIEYSKLHCVHPTLIGFLGDVMQDECYREIFTSMTTLLQLYKELIDKIDVNIIEESFILSSKSQYMKHLLSKCLKLSEGEPTFFEFLLSCIYVGKVAEGLLAKFKCCKMLKVSADCLESIYYRKYWNYFKHNDDFSGLSDFCRKLNNSPRSVEFKNGECLTLFQILEPERNRKVKNFLNLNDIDDSISLSKMEMKLLTDKPFFVPYRESNDFLINMLTVTADPPEEELEDWEVVSDKVAKTGIRCSHCRSKCHQYPSYLAKEYQR